VLGRDLVKEIVSKMFEKIHICLHFNIKNSPDLCNMSDIILKYT